MQTIEVSAGVIIQNDNILITRRAPKQNFAGGWEFPGGKIEDNETPQECLIRELKEELNIDVSIIKPCFETTFDYETYNLKLIAFYCTIINGEISVSVHDKFKWIKINDLLEYNLLPADVPIAKRVMEDYSIESESIHMEWT